MTDKKCAACLYHARICDRLADFLDVPTGSPERKNLDDLVSHIMHELYEARKKAADDLPVY